MRVVVAVVGEAHPIAKRALEELAPQAEFFDVAGDDHAYANAFARWWHDGAAFTLVEGDVEVTADALHDHEKCECPWGTSPYWLNAGTYKPAFGCVRFSGRLLRKFPDIVDEAYERVHGDGSWDPRLWRHLDYTVYEALTERAGTNWHVHAGVVHHHWAKEWGATGRCLCGSTHKEICPERRHHLGDAGCETWHWLAPGVKPTLLPDAIREAEQRSAEQMRQARERAERERDRRRAEIEDLSHHDPWAADREREADRSRREWQRRYMSEEQIEYRRSYGQWTPSAH